MAGDIGLHVTEAVPVGTRSNVIVQLRPHAIVARVMTGTVVLHDDPERWLRRELEVVAFAADRGAPVVHPLRTPPPGPYVSDGLWLSLWDHVEVQRGDPDPEGLGRSLRALHDVLADYSGPLPPRSALMEEIDWLLRALADADDLAADRDRLAGAILAAEDDAQPIHGDASVSNLLITADGPRWNDFEDVCLGSPAWDVAGLVDDARAKYGAAFAAAVERGYGRGFDAGRTHEIAEVMDLYGALWRRYVSVTRGGEA